MKKTESSNFWVILLVIGIAFVFCAFFAFIGAVAYFGALSPDRYVAEKCVLSNGMACLDSEFDPDAGIVISVMNVQGFDMSTVSVTVTGAGCTASNDGGPVSIGDGQQRTFTFSECSKLRGRYKGILEVTYVDPSLQAHKNTGGIVVNAP